MSMSAPSSRYRFQASRRPRSSRRGPRERGIPLLARNRDFDIRIAMLDRPARVTTLVLADHALPQLVDERKDRGRCPASGRRGRNQIQDIEYREVMFLFVWLRPMAEVRPEEVAWRIEESRAVHRFIGLRSWR